jgi:hypothetical protein
MTPFSPLDVATWPTLLTAEQIAAIWQRPVGGVKKSCQQGRFIPAPFQSHPYRWRRSDVLRVVEGQRTTFRRSA